MPSIEERRRAVEARALAIVRAQGQDVAETEKTLRELIGFSRKQPYCFEKAFKCLVKEGPIPNELKEECRFLLDIFCQLPELTDSQKGISKRELATKVWDNLSKMRNGDFSRSDCESAIRAMAKKEGPLIKMNGKLVFNTSFYLTHPKLF